MSSSRSPAPAGRGDTTVHIVVNDTIGRSWQRNVNVQVDADGNIPDSFNLPDRFISDYDVTATGNETGRVATTTFTDAPATSLNFDQCQNGAVAGLPGSDTDCDVSGDWARGNLTGSKAHYNEGESIPQRAVYENLAPVPTP